MAMKTSDVSMSDVLKEEREHFNGVNGDVVGEMLKSDLQTRLISVLSLNEDVEPINTVLSQTTYNGLKAELGLASNVILLAQRQPAHNLAPNPFWTFPREDEIIPDEISTLYRVGVQEDRYYIALIRTPDGDFPALIPVGCNGDTNQTTVREVIERVLGPINLNVVSVQNHGSEGYLDIQKPMDPEKLNDLPNFPTVWIVKTAEDALYKLKDGPRPHIPFLDSMSSQASKLSNISIQCKVLGLQSIFLVEVVNHLIFSLGEHMKQEASTSELVFRRLFRLKRSIDRLTSVFLELDNPTAASQGEVALTETYFEFCRDSYGVVAVREAYRQFLLFQRLDRVDYTGNDAELGDLFPITNSQRASQPYGNSSLENTQTTQEASQNVTGPVEQDISDPNCWGILLNMDGGQPDHPAGSIWRLTKDRPTYTIGRSLNSDIKIMGPLISNNHCSISWDGVSGRNAGIRITDTSRNGTYNARLARDTATLLHDSDEISLGKLGGKGGDCYRYKFRTPISVQEMTGIHVNYDILFELGRGSFAPVYKALHRRTGTFVAVKVIPQPQSSLQSKAAKALEREVAILKSLKHRNIVQLIEVVPSGTDLCLVMELVSGGDLFDYIVGLVRLSEERTADFTAQLCDALAYIHSEGITHRDLKPENILLTGDTPPKIKVADFGLAKCVNSHTMLKTVCGTPSYVAPETVLQTSADPGYDHKVDSWSAGAIVFAMLTGQQAFIENETQSLVELVTSRRVGWEYMREVHCSEQVFDFVERLLRFDPSVRMSLTEALGHAWLHPTYWPWRVPSHLLSSEEYQQYERS